MQEEQDAFSAELACGQIFEREVPGDHAAPVDAGPRALASLLLVLERTGELDRGFPGDIDADDLERLHHPADDAALPGLVAAEGKRVRDLEGTARPRRALPRLLELLAVLGRGEPDAKPVLEFDFDELVVANRHFGLALGAGAKASRPKLSAIGILEPGADRHIGAR